LYSPLEATQDLHIIHPARQFEVPKGQARPFSAAMQSLFIFPSYRLFKNLKDDLDDRERLEAEQGLNDARHHHKATCGGVGESIALDLLEYGMQSGHFV